mgnify:CR=1 FL=1
MKAMPLDRRRLLTSLLGATLFPAAAQAIDFPIPKIETRLVPWKYRRQDVAFKTSEPPGTIVVDQNIHTRCDRRRTPRTHR